MHKVVRTQAQKKYWWLPRIFDITDFGEKISPRRARGFFFTVLTPMSGKEEQTSLSVTAVKWTRYEAFMGGKHSWLSNRGSVWHGSEKDGHVI